MASQPDKLHNIFDIVFRSARSEMGELDVTFEEFVDKLRTTLLSIHGSDVFDNTPEKITKLVEKIQTEDLYLTIGLAKGDAKSWKQFDYHFGQRLLIFQENMQITQRWHRKFLVD